MNTNINIWKNKKGFTLIELLVVIAIIGILSSVVLASLNTAREKGKDASAKGSLSSLRAEAELHYDDQSPHSYGTLNSNGSTGCNDAMFGLPNGPGVLMDAVEKQLKNAGDAQCRASTGTYAVSIKLNSDKFFCVDSSGFAGEVASHIVTTGSTFKCP